MKFLKFPTARRLLILCTLGALAGVLASPLHPVNSMLRNLVFLSCLAGAWGGLTILLWNRKPWRFALLVLPMLGSIPLLLPGRGIDPDELRQDYVRRMSGFEGTKYHWGGENARGIDCSGLPRRALRDALLAYGIRHANSRALRKSLELWWFDSSAKALAEGYRNYMAPLNTTGTIRDMSYDDLIPGDLAITDRGVHVLAYVGNGRWIQADPGVGSVITLNGRHDDNRWFSSPVTTHRWQVVEQADATGTQ